MQRPYGRDDLRLRQRETVFTPQRSSLPHSHQPDFYALSRSDQTRVDPFRVVIHLHSHMSTKQRTPITSLSGIIAFEQDALIGHLMSDVRPIQCRRMMDVDAAAVLGGMYADAIWFHSSTIHHGQGCVGDWAVKWAPEVDDHCSFELARRLPSCFPHEFVAPDGVLIDVGCAESQFSASM